MNSHLVPPTLQEMLKNFLAGVKTDFDSNGLAGFDFMRFSTFCVAEGAKWAASRMALVYIEHPDFRDDAPESAVLAVALEVMDSYTKIRAEFESRGKVKQ